VNDFKISTSTAYDSEGASSEFKINHEMMIIAMSQSHTDDKLERAFQHGLHFFLHKPIDKELLNTILKIRRGSPVQKAVKDISTLLHNAKLSMEEDRVSQESDLSSNSDGSNSTYKNSHSPSIGNSGEVVTSTGPRLTGPGLTGPRLTGPGYLPGSFSDSKLVGLISYEMFKEL